VEGLRDHDRQNDVVDHGGHHQGHHGEAGRLDLDHQDGIRHRHQLDADQRRQDHHGAEVGHGDHHGRQIHHHRHGGHHDHRAADGLLHRHSVV
jgi:hypothetical protein